MPNKKINALDARTAVSTDLMLVGDPATGTAYKSTLATLPLVPTSRTLTINGVAFDLSANRAWTIGTVTSVGLTMPSAFGVANSPITSSGTLAVTALGTASQYIRGDGVLATLPTGGSGGSSVSYYLNGGTAASVGTYYQMSTTAVVGTNADFTRTGNGLISQFLTDVGDPNRLQIPAGNWNFEMFFSMSSNGGTPQFYVELLKYDGTTFTSIASSSAIPEVISGGTIIDLYLTSLAIPATSLLATDRLALRVYIVNNSGGRTATLHTQDSHLCQIITNFAGGVSALNGLTANTQYFATGTSGTDFGISSASDTHTFNLPTASATNRGALSSADWTTFNNKVPTSRTLTINGTTQDLTADRTFTIATANIYNADGTLTSARTLTSGGFPLTFTGSNTAASAIARGLNLTHTLVASANSDVLVGLDINPTFTNGAFTGVTNTGLRVQGINIGLGNGALATNTAIGFQSLNGANSGNAKNASIGYQAGFSNTSGYENTYLGYQAGFSNLSANSNVAIGYQAGYLNTTYCVTAIGSEALRNSTGFFNTAIGFQAGFGIRFGTNNTLIGSQIMTSTTTASDCTIIGHNAARNNTGNNNIALGSSALNANTSGVSNLVFGTNAFSFNTIGNSNIIIGILAGRIATSTANITQADNSIAIGESSTFAGNNQTNQIVIGYASQGLGSNTTMIGNSSTMTTAIRGRLLLGTTTDSGLYQADINGSARIVNKLNLGAGTTSNAQINLASSTAPTSPNNGDIWFDGTNIKMQIGGVTKTFTLL